MSRLSTKQRRARGRGRRCSGLRILFRCDVRAAVRELAKVKASVKRLGMVQS